MDTTIKVNLLDPLHRAAMRAWLDVIDASDKGKSDAKPDAAKPTGRHKAKPPTEPASGASKLGRPNAFTPPAGETPQIGKVKAIAAAMTERVGDADEARAMLKAMLQECFSISSLKRLPVEYAEEVLEFARTGRKPEVMPF